MLSRIKRRCKGVFQSLIGANMANEKPGRFWREEWREEKKPAKGKEKHVERKDKSGRKKIKK